MDTPPTGFYRKFKEVITSLRPTTNNGNALRRSSVVGHRSAFLGVGLFLTLWLIALLLRITTLNDTFIVNDETLYWAWSNQFSQALLNFEAAATLVGKGYPSVTVFWVHSLGLLTHYLADRLQGVAPDLAWQHLALDQPFVFGLLGQRRLAMGVANALLLGVIFWQAKKLLGLPVALLGLGLLAFSPFLLADARTMRGDALMSSLMLISVFAWLIFLRRGHWLHLMISAVAFGLAVLTKITALPLAGWLILAVGVYLWQTPAVPWPVKLRRAVTSLLAWGLLAGLTLILFWPALWVRPLEVLAFIQQYAASSLDGRQNYFWGRLTEAEPLPLFYPTAFLFRATPLMTLGVAVIVGLVLVTLWRQLAGFIRHRNAPRFPANLWAMPPSAIWTLLALVAYCVLYGLVLDGGALKRDRYLMPIFPAAGLLAAAGLLWLRQWLSARRWGRFSAGSWAILGVLLAIETAHILTTHPFYYTYWNPLMGGGAVAEHMMLAEGGVETSALTQLNHQPNAAQKTVAVQYERDVAPAFGGKTVRLTYGEPWITADYVLLRQFHLQTQDFDPYQVAYLRRRPPEQTIAYQGYTWAWLYPGPAAHYDAGSSKLEGRGTLLGYNLTPNPVAETRLAAGNPLTMTLFWRNEGQQPADRFFVRLMDVDGYIWAEALAQPLPGFEEAARQRESILESEAVLTLPVGMPPGDYFIKPGFRTAAGELIGYFDLPGDTPPIHVTPALRYPPPGQFQPPQAAVVTISPTLNLIGYEVAPQPVAPGTSIWATLYWQTLADVNRDYVVLLRLLNPQGQEAAYWLGRPVRSGYPTTEWRAGQIVQDPWLLPLPADAPPGTYQLELAVFEAETQAELTRRVLGPVIIR